MPAESFDIEAFQEAVEELIKADSTDKADRKCPRPLPAD